MTGERACTVERTREPARWSVWTREHAWWSGQESMHGGACGRSRGASGQDGRGTGGGACQQAGEHADERPCARSSMRVGESTTMAPCLSLPWRLVSPIQRACGWGSLLPWRLDSPYPGAWSLPLREHAGEELACCGACSTCALSHGESMRARDLSH